VIQLSWRPRAFLLKKFLTDEECEHIKAKVRAHHTTTASNACAASPRGPGSGPPLRGNAQRGPLELGGPRCC
jgi:hypothetical protein